MTKLMAKECLFILTVLNIKANGKMICSMDMEKKRGLIQLLMKDNLNVVKSMEKVYNIFEK